LRAALVWAANAAAFLVAVVVAAKAAAAAFCSASFWVFAFNSTLLLSVHAVTAKNVTKRQLR
jgi:hypothetical protein